MLPLPLVSIICTVYNHQEFVKEALLSVFWQTYPRIELIIIDNCSQDNSVKVIEEVIAGRSNVVFIRNRENAGLCKAFNQGFALSSGAYIVDLSADDILLPERVQKQVAHFNKLSTKYAVVFTNASIIDTSGNLMRYHYPVDANGKAEKKPPAGNIYQEVLRGYFICTPTMMVRRAVLAELGGYDEQLSYEDFDFWVRSSVEHHYGYLDDVLTCKREVESSLSKQVIKKGGGILDSTFVVCLKAKELNRCLTHDMILANRIKKFVRKCWYAQEYRLAFKFKDLLESVGEVDYGTSFVLLLCRFRVPVNKLYRIYLNYFYQKKVKIKRVFSLKINF
jgi:glycosyltransferase involved in cell wall biosynthesis